jgi:hypothetical protein
VTAAIENFITHWRGATGGERAQSQSFLIHFCQALGLTEPKEGDYKFEFDVRGDKGRNFIDLYKRGCFVLESKQSRARRERSELPGQADLLPLEDTAPRRDRASRAWDVLMNNARQQAENYARHLPADHDWPPFIIVCDVGHCFELYADFTGKGRNYTQFPDRQGFRHYVGAESNLISVRKASRLRISDRIASGYLSCSRFGTTSLSPLCTIWRNCVSETPS